MNKIHPTEETKKFTDLGIFFDKCSQSKSSKNFFQIYYRRTYLNFENFIEELIFRDISELKFKDKKILEKIINRFKIPLIFSLAACNTIKDDERSFSFNSYLQIKMIANSINLLIFSISDISEFSYMENINCININISEFNSKETINFCYDVLECLLKMHGNKMEKIIAEKIIPDNLEMLEIKGDERRLKQLLLNFISNAVTFTNKGKIILKCTKKEIENKFFLKIKIKDTGIGIIKEELDNLYIVSNIGENNIFINSRNNDGIGLKVCKVLAEKMNFKLLFKSLHKKGSSFSLIIPILSENINSKHSKKLTNNSEQTNKISEEFQKYNHISFRTNNKTKEFDYFSNSKIENNKIILEEKI